MNIEIRKLTPKLAEDYVNFFDITPHDDNIDEHKCYCVCWSNDNSEGKDFSSREKRRDIAFQYVKESKIQGYLAYIDDKVVGWCNTNQKSDCLKCESWRRFMGYVPTEEEKLSIKVKSIFCFVIAPEMKRTGIATQLLECVCKDAVHDGFDFIEAYPNKNAIDEASNFGGYYDMYRKNGFVVSYETEQGFVVRKQLR